MAKVKRLHIPSVCISILFRRTKVRRNTIEIRDNEEDEAFYDAII